LSGVFRNAEQAAAEHQLVLDRRLGEVEADLAALRLHRQMLTKQLGQEERRSPWLPEIKGLLVGLALAPVALLVLTIGALLFSHLGPRA
jgi:hypothetical protein